MYGLATSKRTGRQLMIMGQTRRGYHVVMDMVSGKVVYLRPEDVEVDHEATAQVMAKVREQLEGGVR